MQTKVSSSFPAQLLLVSPSSLAFLGGLLAASKSFSVLTNLVKDSLLKILFCHDFSEELNYYPEKNKRFISGSMRQAT